MYHMVHPGSPCNRKGTRGGAGPRQPFQHSDAIWFMEMATKYCGHPDPFDVLADLTLRLDAAGRLEPRGLRPSERAELSACRQNALFDRAWPVEWHHLDGDRANNSRTNLALVFRPTHRIVGRPAIRCWQVAVAWHEILRSQGCRVLWLPAPNRLRTHTMPEPANSNVIPFKAPSSGRPR